MSGLVSNFRVPKALLSWELGARENAASWASPSQCDSGSQNKHHGSHTGPRTAHGQTLRYLLDLHNNFAIETEQTLFRGFKQLAQGGQLAKEG